MFQLRIFDKFDNSTLSNFRATFKIPKKLTLKKCRYIYNIYIPFITSPIYSTFLPQQYSTQHLQLFPLYWSPFPLHFLESFSSPFLESFPFPFHGVLSFFIPWSSFLLHSLELFPSPFLGVLSFSIILSPFLLHSFEFIPSSSLIVLSFSVPRSHFLLHSSWSPFLLHSLRSFLLHSLESFPSSFLGVLSFSIF